MKFFKQTKETKRKISFFMALAMVISLLPVSPVVKAATKTGRETIKESKVYVTNNCSKYVTVDDVVTGTAVEGKVTTASVILGRAGSTEFTDVIANPDFQNQDYITIKNGETVTLGSIKVKENSSSITGATIVLKDKGTGSVNTGNTCTISSSSVGIANAVAKVKIAATGSALSASSKNITGAVISIDAIEESHNIEIEIIEGEGEDDKPTHQVHVTNEGRNFIYEAKYNNKVLWATSSFNSDYDINSGFVDIPEGDKINITVKPLVNEVADYTFEKEGAEKPTVNGKPAQGSNDVYTYDYTVTSEETQIVLISAVAISKKFDVTINGNKLNPNINLKLTSTDTYAKPVTSSTFGVYEGKTVTIEVSPKEGYIWNGENSKPSLKVNNSNINWTVNGDKLTYVIREGSVIIISGGDVIPYSGDKKKVTVNAATDGSIAFNYADIELEVTGKDGASVVTGKAFDVAKGEKITLTVTPKDTDALWREAPALKVNPASALKDWEDVTGTTSKKVTFEITEDTEITVSGGTVTVVKADSNVEEKGEVASGVESATGIKDVSIENATELKDVLLQAAVEHVVKEYITIKDKDGKDMEVTDNLINEILEVLKSGNTIVNTLLNINTVENSAAELNKVTNANATDIKTADGKENHAAIKALEGKVAEKVKEMLKGDNKVLLDITLNSLIKLGDNSASIKITETSKAIKITMDVPKQFKDDKGAAKEGYYYAIRIHKGKDGKEEITVIPCDLKDGKISFESDKFSTYIVSFLPKDNNPNTPSGSNAPYYPSLGGGGGYTPGTPAPSATPSATPSTTPSVSPTPGTTASAVPGDGSSSGVTPTKAPEATKTPGSTGNGDKDNDKNTGGTKTSVKVGKKVTVNSSKYKVTSVKSGSRAVQFTKGRKNAKSVVIPGTVKISGKNYKVTSIAKNAFKGNKKLKKVTIGANVNKIGKAAFKGCKNLKSIIVKTKKLTAKKTGANAFKGINKKATFKVPKKKVKAYKKIVKAKGAAKTVKVKK